MHEMGVTQHVVNIVLRHAEMSGARRVVTVSLRIGELRDVIPEWMQRFFDYLSRGTIAEGATLVIDRSPITFACNCGKSFTVSIKGIREKTDVKCPCCGGEKITLSSGREFDILSIEVM